MLTASGILNFTFSPSTLKQAANNVFLERNIQLYQLRINKLNTIIEKIGENSFKSDSKPRYPQVFKKFNNAIINSPAQLISINNFDKRELKTLAYCLDYSEFKVLPILSSTISLKVAIRTLERDWKDNFLFGLIRCYFQNWESSYLDSLQILYDFIVEKLKQYQGERTVLKSFKENIKFFDIRNGDVVLGSELALNNKHIKDATRFLSLPDSWFAYPYFSKVIVAYYNKRKMHIANFIDDLNNALNEHNNSISNRRLISKLIIQANSKEYLPMKDKVKRIALVKLFDPQKKESIWHPFETASLVEIEELETAKKIMHRWIAEEFITVFFEKCINDSRRKRFWLKYAKEITQFRVVGSTYIRQLLMSENRISEYVPPRFSSTNSSRDSNAALMFIMKNYLFVEFSDNGSFYVYKLTNKDAPSINQDFFSSINDLKLTYLLQLVDRNSYYITYMAEEGKLPHRDGHLNWENVAEYWLKNKAGIDV